MIGLEIIWKLLIGHYQGIIPFLPTAYLGNCVIRDSRDRRPMIKKFFSNAMLSIVMDKAAKEKLHAVRESRKALNKKINNPSAPDTKAPVTSEAAAHTPNVNRQALIRNAMAVHKEHSKVLDNLSENEKRRLQLLAMHIMLEKKKK